MADTDNEDRATEKQSEQESSTLIDALNSMKASIVSGNSLLQELVSRKRSSPDDKIRTSKRRKSQCSASQKAKAMSSDVDENDASEKANTQHHHDASEADALSLFGGGDIDEIEDTVLEDMEDGD